MEDHSRRWRALRLALVLLWLVAAVTAGWTAPREVAYARAQADILDGRVTAYQWGTYWDDDQPGRWFGRPTLVSTQERGPLFAWQLPDGRVRWTDTGRVDDGTASLARAAQSAGLPGPRTRLAPLGRVVDGISLALGLVFLAVVIRGPAPALGTRWYWFWVGALPPYGIGFLFWLVRERPWSRPAAPDPRRRDRGFLGLVTALLLAFAVSIVRFLVGGL